MDGCGGGLSWTIVVVVQVIGWLALSEYAAAALAHFWQP